MAQVRRGLAGTWSITPMHQREGTATITKLCANIRIAIQLAHVSKRVFGTSSPIILSVSSDEDQHVSLIIACHPQILFNKFARLRECPRDPRLIVTAWCRYRSRHCSTLNHCCRRKKFISLLQVSRFRKQLATLAIVFLVEFSCLSQPCSPSTSRA